ncbi:MAG: aminoglycoside phosphotransferase family protein [Phycisphaerae bacterium]|nr:aminoglycoside phosphotransferase family protein [Phycisphaerae bacterium]
MALEVDAARKLVETALGPGRRTVRPFGAGKFSDVFAVDGDDGHYVLRVAPPDTVRQLFYERRMMRQEPALHARLRTETSVPVPDITFHDFSRVRIDRDWLIMPRLPGVPLSRAALHTAARHRALEQWGRYVAQIHALTDPAGRFGYLGEHDCMIPQPSWAEAFAVMVARELDDIVDCGVFERSEADAAVRLLRDNLAAFDHGTSSRLLHGDLWVTNLLVDPDGQTGQPPGTVAGMLDFDRACWGDVEWDLAIAEYCGVTSPPFWRGYQAECRQLGLEDCAEARARIGTDAGQLRRMFYLLYEHAKYIVIRVSSRHDDPAAAQRYARDCRTVLDNFRRTGRPAF